MSEPKSIGTSEEKPVVEYRDVPGFPGYRVGDDGSVWSRWNRKGFIGTTWKPLALLRATNGYLFVGILREKRKYQPRVHRLVLEAFVGPCPKGMECAHGNGIRDDNRLPNLRWATPKENAGDRVKHGTSGIRNGTYRPGKPMGRARRGEEHHAAKLTMEDVGRIRELAGVKRRSALAREFGVSATTIDRVIKREGWTFVASPQMLPEALAIR